jgi:hypothetical protein
VLDVLTHDHKEVEQLRAEVRQLRQQLAESERRRGDAVFIDADTQQGVAIVGQARGVTLRACRTLLEVLIPGQVQSMASLDRRTRAAGVKGCWTSSMR